MLMIIIMKVPVYLGSFILFGSVLICQVNKYIINHRNILINNIQEHHKRIIESWSTRHPGWELRVWSDDNIGIIALSHPQTFHTAKNFGMKSDILRYEVCISALGRVVVEYMYEYRRRYIYLIISMSSLSYCV